MAERRTAFITGAASGIGRATARLFAAKGWFVGAADTNRAGLDALEQELGADCCATWQLDVTDKAAFDRVIAEFGERTGNRMDLLHNNAGIGAAGFFEDIPLERALQMVQVNLVGVIHGIYAALPLLKNTPNSLCFSTSSSAATYGAPSLAVYAATKFAVKGLTEALSVELSRAGVRVADVLPGLIDTNILVDTPRYLDGRRVDVPAVPVGASAPTEGPFRLVSPDEVAEAVWNAYGSDRVHWYVPAEIEEIDKLKAQSVEAIRNARIAALEAPAG